jgi:Domain of unknown function (DUF222)
MCLPEQSARDATLAELAALDPIALDAAGLMGQISDLAAFISQAQAQLARLTAALDAAGGASAAGHKSAAAFLRTRCGLTAAHAAEITATGRALRELTATEKALQTGEISFDQAHIISRTAAGLDGDKAGPVEQVLLDNAPGLDTSQFRRLAAEVSYRADPDAAEERERKRWERRHLSFGLTLDDTGLLHGACGDTASFEILRTAAEAFAPPGGVADTRSAAQRRMDGLVTACKVALDGGRAPQRHGSAPHVTVLVRDETLAQAPGAPPAQTGHGQALTARQVLAMCCAAQVSAIRWADGLPLDIGRAARTEPPGLRRALEARDRRCRWPGCDALAAWATAHHIKGWRRGARTALNELVLLCHVHHAYFIHQLGWTITGDPNGTLRFTHPVGIVTLDSPLPGAARPEPGTAAQA